MAVVTFAGATRLVRPPEPPAEPPELPWPLLRTATDLGTAIDDALALYPPGGERRLLLVTDGNETRGNGREKVALLRSESVRVDAIVPPQDDRGGVEIEKLVVPPVISEAGIIPLRVLARNPGPPRPAVLKLHIDGLLMDSAAVELGTGLNSLPLRTEIQQAGSHLLRAELVLPGDVAARNDFAQANLTVRGPMRLLLVAPRAGSPLARILERKGFEIDAVSFEGLPARAEDLARYHAVLLEDAASQGLDGRSLAEIERYVADFGGGLVFAAGANTFGDARLAESPLKRLLPLTLEPRHPEPGSREPLALFLLIDRSNSMGYNSRVGTIRDGEKLRYAKEAALTVVRQLKDHDLVGVIAFDSQPREIARLEPLRENRRRLERLLPRLVESGGTDFYDALDSARRQLVRSRVNRRHVILLTDGDTNRSDPAEYRSLLHRVAKEQITVTTIRIGDNTINLKLLEQISRETGGEFHHVEDARTLPGLMLKDAARAVGPESPHAEQFFPQLGAPSQVLRGIEEERLPALDGYAYARVKRGAEVALRVTRLDRTDPLLAAWQYGLGRVVAFAASPREDARPWLAWDEHSRFWSQVVHWASRPHSSGETTIDVTREGELAQLNVRTFGPGEDDDIILARIHLGPEETREVRLVPTERRVFSAPVHDLPAGLYPVTVVRRDAGHRISEGTQMVAVPEAGIESREEKRRRSPNLALLKELTAGTGGELNPSAREITSRALGRERVHYDIDHLLIPLAMLLFLADVAVRRRRTRRPVLSKAKGLS
jgi:Mg-chelatase subunit ChlD